MAEEVIQSIYDNPSKLAAFFGAKKNHKVLQNSGVQKPGIHKIRRWLQKQDDYSLQKPARRRFTRAKVVVSDINEQWDVDLADMQSLSKENGARYLLVAIDIFSRFARVYPLKNKTGKEVAKGLEQMFQSAQPKKIRSDAGSEFKNAYVTNLFKSRNIYHHIALNEVKANYVEHLNKTLNVLIWRFLARKRTKRYTDILPKLVESYNSTPHRSINNVAPKDVNENNSADIWAYMYLKPRKQSKQSALKSLRNTINKAKTLYRYKIGQLVRLSHQRKPFTRVYNKQWTYEVFKISRRFQMQSIPLYCVVDLLGEEVLGNWYQAEIQPIDRHENALWEIQKVLKTRRINNKTQCLVKWTGYSDKFNSWVDKSEVKNL